jgi:hypothetical protein
LRQFCYNQETIAISIQPIYQEMTTMAFLRSHAAWQLYARWVWMGLILMAIPVEENKIYLPLALKR